LYAKKQRTRGYNQAELIADRLGGLSGIKVDADILVRSRATVPQKNLNDAQRAENIKKAFTITRNIIKYKRVLLVDDIYTTGSTVDECAKALKAAGVERVYCASLCVGGGV
jgi:ComF family protein